MGQRLDYESREKWSRFLQTDLPQTTCLCRQANTDQRILGEQNQALVWSAHFSTWCYKDWNVEPQSLAVRTNSCYAVFCSQR